ncbi:MAG TPA: DNA polymerase III subunit chi [Steroidobacteraceae bacterium]|nr:DNA polymerase III subunit chi [Steroidobacteraceae bacterium]
MGDSDGISASAASSGDDSSPPGSSAADQRPRVDFYVMEGTAAARLRVACRLAEKAYLASQRTLIWHTDRAELEALDELLWIFADGSFVPHEWLTSNQAQAPVLLSAGSPPEAAFDFVINLAADPPPFLPLARRIAEIIDGDEERRRAGRARFKAYRELGIQPATHTLRTE